MKKRVKERKRKREEIVKKRIKKVRSREIRRK